MSRIRATMTASAKGLHSRPLFSLFEGTFKIDVAKVRRFTNLDGNTIDFASAYKARVIAKAKDDPLTPRTARG